VAKGPNQHPLIKMRDANSPEGRQIKKRKGVVKKDLTSKTITEAPGKKPRTWGHEKPLQAMNGTEKKRERQKMRCRLRKGGAPETVEFRPKSPAPWRKGREPGKPARQKKTKKREKGGFFFSGTSWAAVCQTRDGRLVEAHLEKKNRRRRDSSVRWKRRSTLEMENRDPQYLVHKTRGGQMGKWRESPGGLMALLDSPGTQRTLWYRSEKKEQQQNTKGKKIKPTTSNF